MFVIVILFHAHLWGATPFVVVCVQEYAPLDNDYCNLLFYSTLFVAVCIQEYAPLYNYYCKLLFLLIIIVLPPIQSHSKTVSILSLVVILRGCQSLHAYVCMANPFPSIVVTVVQ